MAVVTAFELDDRIATGRGRDLVGALFRSTDFQNDRSELVFVVTARILRDPAQKIRLPTDGFKESTRTERFLGGDLESQQRPTQR